ncbi:unnamed protein product [Urochloa decumbens]|uniref:Uncharacterized protein n=1 Tax=Urochloa decumbens TaxID=240449 RepID=A0ABC8ZDR7_9POAL
MPHGGSLTSPKFDFAICAIPSSTEQSTASSRSAPLVLARLPPKRPSSASTELKKMCKEGAYWGTIAGVYVGVKYGIDKIRGHRDWKNAMLGGAVTGALVSAVNNNQRHKVVKNAITGGAIAAAAEFLSHPTS